MAQYVNYNSKGQRLPARGKVDALLADGALIIQLSALQEGDIVVAESAGFDAALFVDEYVITHPERYNFIGDQRKLTFLRYSAAKTIIEKYGAS